VLSLSGCLGKSFVSVRGTYDMYFPFLTCEVKCGAAALDIADWLDAADLDPADLRRGIGYRSSAATLLGSTV